MKIKITEPGSENYTGQLGDVRFVEGESVGEVSEQSFAHISSVMKVATLIEEPTEAQAQDTTESSQAEPTLILDEATDA